MLTDLQYLWYIFPNRLNIIFSMPACLIECVWVICDVCILPWQERMETTSLEYDSAEY